MALAGQERFPPGITPYFPVSALRNSSTHHHRTKTVTVVTIAGTNEAAPRSAQTLRTVVDPRPAPHHAGCFVFLVIPVLTPFPYIAGQISCAALGVAAREQSYGARVIEAGITAVADLSENCGFV